MSLISLLKPFLPGYARLFLLHTNLRVRLYLTNSRSKLMMLEFLHLPGHYLIMHHLMKCYLQVFGEVKVLSYLIIWDLCLFMRTIYFHLGLYFLLKESIFPQFLLILGFSSKLDSELLRIYDGNVFIVIKS